MKKPKTPEELANEPRGKGKYTLYLSVEPMEYIKSRAAKAGSNTSEVVDEAIRMYLEVIGFNKKRDK